MTTTDFADIHRLADKIGDMASKFKAPSHERGVCNEACQTLRALAPADPLDMPLPCDVTVGHGTHKKGTALRSLVLRMGLLYEDAQRYYQLAAATTGPNDPQHLVSAQGESHAAIRYAEGFGKGHDAGWAAAMAHTAAHQSLPTAERTTMSTVDKAFADNIKQHNGFYNGDDEPAPDNPRCVEITEYDNAFGSIAYGLTFEGQRNRYEASEYVGNPRRYWAYQA